MDKLKYYLQTALEKAQECADFHTMLHFKSQAYGAVSFYTMCVWDTKPELEAAATKLWEEEYEPAFDKLIMQ